MSEHDSNGHPDQAPPQLPPPPSPITATLTLDMGSETLSILLLEAANSEVIRQKLASVARAVWFAASAGLPGTISFDALTETGAAIQQLYDAEYWIEIGAKARREQNRFANFIPRTVTVMRKDS